MTSRYDLRFVVMIYRYDLALRFIERGHAALRQLARVDGFFEDLANFERHHATRGDLHSFATLRVAAETRFFIAKNKVAEARNFYVFARTERIFNGFKDLLNKLSCFELRIATFGCNVFNDVDFGQRHRINGSAVF